jgi:hypothetical protein
MTGNEDAAQELLPGRANDKAQGLKIAPPGHPDTVFHRKGKVLGIDAQGNLFRQTAVPGAVQKPDKNHHILKGKGLPVIFEKFVESVFLVLSHVL